MPKNAQKKEDISSVVSLIGLSILLKRQEISLSRMASSRIQKQGSVAQSPGRMAAPIVVLMESAQKKTLVP